MKMANNSKTLIIFSTDFIYTDQDKPRSEDLFNSERIVTPIPSGRLDKFFEEEFGIKNEHPIYQIKNKGGQKEAIFGRKMLEDRHLDKKEGYLTNLVSDILIHLKDESNNYLKLEELQEIKLIAHRKEFYSTKNINKYKLDVEDQDLFDQIEETIKNTLSKSLEYSHSKEENQISKEKVFIEFIAFSHDPGHLIFRLLKDFRESSKTDSPLSEQIRKVIENDKIDFEERVELEDLKLIKNGLLSTSIMFNYHFFEVNESGSIKHVENIDLLTPRNKTIAQLLDINQNASAYDLAVLFAPVKLLSDFKFYKRVPNFFHNKGKKPFEPFSVPLLTISYPDFMADELKGGINTQNNKESESEIDRLIKGVYDNLKNDDHFWFLDSSIWYRYVSYANNQIFNDQLSDALHTFCWAYERKLYNKRVTKEYLEFSNRQIENAFLDHQFGQGHASLINPLKFHSEYFMKVEAEKRYHALTSRKNRNNKNSKKKINWNILLLDDYGESPLSDIPNAQNPDKEPELTKKEIIQELIDNSIEKISERNNLLQESYSILNEKRIDVVTDIEKAPGIIQQKVKPERTYKKVYDIILLDYLFSKTDDDKPHYGTEFLEKISAGDLTEGKSLFQYYWIFPISIFSESMLLSFKEKGIQPINDNWQLARGADPNNTPNLFRFNLLDFLKVQFDKLYFDERDIWNFFVEFPIPMGSGVKSIRNWAINVFRMFLERFSAIDSVPNGSAIGESVKRHLMNDKIHSYKLMVHVRQFLYLSAFRTGFDSVLIEREFYNIHELLNLFIKSDKYDEEKDSEIFREVQQNLKTLEKLVIQVRENHC